MASANAPARTRTTHSMPWAANCGRADRTTAMPDGARLRLLLALNRQRSSWLDCRAGVAIAQ